MLVSWIQCQSWGWDPVIWDRIERDTLYRNFVHLLKLLPSGDQSVLKIWAWRFSQAHWCWHSQFWQQEWDSSLVLKTSAPNYSDSSQEEKWSWLFQRRWCFNHQESLKDRRGWPLPREKRTKTRTAWISGERSRGRERGRSATRNAWRWTCSRPYSVVPECRACLWLTGT